MRLARLVLLSVAVLVATATSAVASPISVFNTGTDSSGVLVAPGAAASLKWVLVSAPGGATEALGSGTFRYHHPAYFADSATAAWVSAAPSGSHSAGGLYTYRLTFDLTGFDITSAAISGVYGTDNDGSIRLNGGAPVATTAFAAFGGQTAFSMNSGFVAGLNNIEVTMNSVAGGQPTAFFVQFGGAQANLTTAAAVPEPASLLLVGAGLVALAARARRRSR